MKAKIVILLLFSVLAIAANAQTSVIWSGSANSDWNNPLNWNTNAIPASCDSIIIPNTSNHPVLDTNRTIGKLTVASGAKFYLGSANLTVLGNWENSGIIYSGTSTVKFSGTVPQEIIGNQTFNNLQISNESGVSIVSGTDSLKGILNLQSGTFYTNNSFVILSDTNGTGSIAPIINGSISGEITMQRYVAVTSSDWRFFSSPVASSTLNNISDDFWTSGFTGSTYPGYGFVSVYFYDETVAGTADLGYTAPTSINDSIQTGQGFMAYIGTTSLMATVDFSGVPNTGNINLPVTYTLSDTVSDGWNLVGNPYPSAINWDDTTITKTGIYNAIYLWDAEAGVYTSYIDGIGTNGGTGIIASSQSFYVIAYDLNPQLGLTENCKVSEPGNFFKTVESSFPLSIKIENSFGSDETILKMNNDATTGFDGSLDAQKMFSSTFGLPSMCTTMPGGTDYYSINQFPVQEITIPLSVWTSSSEIHTISFSGFSDFTHTSCIFIEDLATGISYNLAETQSISVYISDTTSAPRFLIHFGAPVYVVGYNATCYNENDGYINFAKNSDSNFDLIWRDGSGNILSAEPGVYQISSFENITAGQYTVESTDQLCGNRIDSIYINQPQQISSQFSASSDTIYLNENSTEIFFSNESINANYFFWEFGDLGWSNLSNPTFSFDVAGISLVKLTAYQNAGCFEVSEKIIQVISTAANDELFEDSIEIRVNGEELIMFAENIDAVEVRNISGQLLFVGSSFSNQSAVDLSGIAHQILVVSLIKDGKVITKKIMY